MVIIIVFICRYDIIVRLLQRFRNGFYNLPGRVGDTHGTYGLQSGSTFFSLGDANHRLHRQSDAGMSESQQIDVIHSQSITLFLLLLDAVLGNGGGIILVVLRTILLRNRQECAIRYLQRE